jgi:hypothetical protein
MFLDFFLRFWNEEANKRYKIYKANRIIARNKEIELFNKLVRYEISLGEYYSLREFVKSRLDCTDSEIDLALESSITHNMNMRNTTKWPLIPIIIKYNIRPSMHKIHPSINI